MTLGEAISQAVSVGVVAGYVALRAYEAYRHYSDAADDVQRRREDEHRRATWRHADSDDEGDVSLVDELLHNRRSEQEPVLYAYGGGTVGIPVFGLPGTEDAGEGLQGASDQLAAQLLHLQLGMMDRDFTEADYELLMQLEEHSRRRPTPVSQEQLAALPQHAYRAPTRPGCSSGGGSSGNRFLRCRSSHDSKSGNKTCSSQSAGDTTQSCAICLDDFETGSQVSALPCAHQFHIGCVEPWLRQKGTAVTCPVCKTPIFQ